MSLEKIVQEALAGRPLEMKEAFDEVIKERVHAALEEKYTEILEGDKPEEELEEETDLAEADEEDEDEDDDGEDEDEDDDDDDDKKIGNEMKKLHASACSKLEMFGKMKEKYGCDKSRFEGLYASYCKG